MKLVAIHQKRDYQGKLIREEKVVIIQITQANPELQPEAIYVLEDGEIGQDIIAHFTITNGAW